MRRSTRSTVSWAAVVSGLTIVAFALRLAFLHDSLFGDELFMFDIVHDRSLGGVMSVVVHTEKTPPLFFLLAWASAKLGDPTVWMRVPSLIFGTALVPMAYVLGVRTVGRVAAVVAAAILTLDPFALFYGVEGRAYAAIAFLAAFSTWCLLRALDTNDRRWWVAYGLGALAALYTHYMGAFVLVVQVAWALRTHRSRVRELIVVNGLVVLGFVPWIPWYLVQQRHSGDEARRIAALAPVSLKFFGQVNAVVLFGHPFVSLSQLPGRAAVTLGVTLIAVAAVAAAARVWRAPGGMGLASPRVLVGLLAVATPAGVALISLRPHMSFLLPRNLSPSLVMMALLVGWLLVSLDRHASVPAVALLLAVLVVGAVRMFNPENRRSPYRQVAHFIDARARPGDPVVQHFVQPVKGALADVLRVELKHPHAVFQTPAGEARAWERGRREAHVFVVWQLPGVFKVAKRAGRFTGPGKDFVLVAQGRYRGLEDVLVGEYTLRRR
jgi:4-amino-4-deoxy-L-arabinose transferase-like glycosyltransferase